MSINVPSSPARAALNAFLARADVFCAATGWAETRLSRRLFTDDDRIAAVRTTTSDFGVKRLAQADEDLSRLAVEHGVTLPDAVENEESESETARPLQAGAA